ncbi:hypothetical protein A3G63_01330 [Candidatus Kaiserbacteria bacterium RIFCSPLOWO2_12_FULL_52_8]|uniref:DUF6922 domain-containing protein n=1 Tax=Candidatus Kaiserbacteria bacterium RIFCSPHIGHO2_01_FULL_53_31 TaxID=1798481 RepID=A0A1F6CIU3_9BACT|nr:MAG: hypothetical protein A2678_02405 [Candidatus Kaiserbacteria bacterium RIFCSPHIGHO2_01_FULL_53_31]OGG94358.1 MAG: hypothetical protein A3G63_01330 [Candidatus Kaiserbacteria bacterium RIFCSPLOWO2_12_FULL_52_8]
MISIPASAVRLFWDVNPRTLDLAAHKGVIIERMLNYGTLDDWRWLISTYGLSVVRDALTGRGSVRQSGIRKESAGLAALLIR